MVRLELTITILQTVPLTSWVHELKIEYNNQLYSDISPAFTVLDGLQLPVLLRYLPRLGMTGFEPMIS